MPDWSWTPGRLLSFLASPALLVAALAFFLPWYAVSCSGVHLASGSGFDVATSGMKMETGGPLGALGGSGTSGLFGGGGGSGAGGGLPFLPGGHSSFSFDIDDEEDAGAGGMLFSPPSRSHKSKSSTTLASSASKPKNDPAPWLFGVPVLALVGAVLALISAFARPDKGRLVGVSGAALGLAAVALMVVHFIVLHARIDEAMEELAKASAKSPAAPFTLSPTGLITVDPQIGWIVAVGLGTMGALLGIAGALARRAPLAPQRGGWA